MLTLEDLLEAEKRNILPPKMQANLDEARKRNLPVVTAHKPLYPVPLPDAMKDGGIIHGMARGVTDLFDSSAQLTYGALEAVAPKNTGFESWAKDKRKLANLRVKAGLDEYRQARQKAGHADDFDWGRYLYNPLNFAGAMGLASKIPQAASLGGRLGQAAAASGTFAMATTPAEDDKTPFWQEKTQQGAVGAAAGGLTAGLVAPFARLFNPKSTLDPAAKKLIDQGVHPPVGSLMGGTSKRIEDSLRSVPLAGGLIHHAYEQAQKEFNEAAVNQVSQKIGKLVSGHLNPGHQQIAELHNLLSQAYQDLMPNLSARSDPAFQRALKGIMNDAQTILPPNEMKQFQAFLDTQLHRRFKQGNNHIEGDTLKALDSVLTQETTKHLRANNQLDKNNRGQLLSRVEKAFYALLTRQNPKYAPELQRINNAWGHYKILEEAAGRVGAKEGVFTPSGLKFASRQQDVTQSHQASAHGKARFQDHAEAGERFLGNSVADSGTAGRLMMGQGMLRTATGITQGAPLLLPYLPGVRQVIAKTLRNRPDDKAFAEFLRRNGLALTPFTGSAMKDL
ncbi:MAG: hypothetical protein N0E59_02280 [Candidatus Thiodiazotropha taylori]|nr:hypothetical protein [Candidatus Thiodiazotropha taylori]MCG8051929.1 hypothetical protein [Candidatus Thiodiazotropha taylori]MCG8109567.1 hypothetical protein [Candidatus Thiodiazotropha taylori]MCW4281911.1 hypothetical protein [Candidatus Thiodiazotropha taylori]MCW4306097.1 hypothetical protein [Candidatus Thiodiazotropha taylori]